VLAWGENASGQLGNGTTTFAEAPVAVGGLPSATSVAAGSSHSLARTSDGRVWAWGLDNRGQLGAGGVGSSSVPIAVSGLSGAASVAAGFAHSFAIMNDGTLAAWGANSSCQLGNGLTEDAFTPVVVSGLSTVVGVAGGDTHSLALLADGSVWAWGANESGQLGTGDTLTACAPVRVSGMPAARFVAASQRQSLAVARDGTVWVWGENREGLFGADTPASSSVPLQVVGLAGITRVAASMTFRAAVWNDEVVLTWGLDSEGQLGRAFHPPTRIPLQVACGCAPDRDGDAIPDLWEEGPVDINADGVADIDLAAAGANPDHRDVFVEIDAMAGRAPHADALAAVVSAFAAAPNALVRNPDGRDGVSLHLVLDETDLPLEPWGRDAWARFDTVRAAHFGSVAERADANGFATAQARAAVFRYALFADRHLDSDSEPTRSGAAETPGDDLFVTLGAWPVPGGTTEQQAGTLMHELGHVLGLLHRGDDDGAGAPNYHSVMNPPWQVPVAGIASSWTLDFSREAWPSLDENALDEGRGIGGHAGHLVVVGPLVGGLPRVAPESGPVDWSRDGDTSDAAIAADVDDVDPQHAPSPGLTVEGFEDWSALQYQVCGSLNFTIGKHPGTTIDHEVALQRVVLMSRALGDCDRDGVADADEIASGAATDCDADGLPDACQLAVGLAGDCDRSGVADWCEIAAGTVADVNANGVPDACECLVPAPTDVPQLRVARSATGVSLTWTSSAPGHDVLVGSLATLRAGGDWAAATDACLARDQAPATLEWDGSPATGMVAFFLVRGRTCGGAGTWDSGSGAQPATRDPGLSAACR
jgi:hypothetical protein